MSDYDWECPSCGELIFYSDPAYYSASLDDNVCYECHEYRGDTDVPDGSYQVASDNIRDDA